MRVMSKYRVKCRDIVTYTVEVDATSIEEAKGEAADQVRYGREIRVAVCLYDYASVIDEHGVTVWEC